MMKKIDKRKSYKMMIDVETTMADNHQQVVFDLGVAVFTKDGKSTSNAHMWLKKCLITTD